MGYTLKQSQTAHPIVFGPMILLSDHISAATGKTLTVTISKDGGSFASPAGAVTEVGNGYYKIAGNATDSGTLGTLTVNSTESSCDPFNDDFLIVAYDPFSATGFVSSVPSVVGAVGSVTAGVTVTTNNDKTGYTASTVSDKTGYALTSGEHTSIAADVLDAAQSSHNTAGTIGNKIGNLDATVSSRSTYAGGAVASVTGAVGSVTGNVGGNVTGSVGSVVSGVTVTTNNDKTGYTASTVSDKTGYALTSGEHTNIAADVLDATAASHVGAGTVGNKISNLDATVSSRSTYAGGAVASVTGNVSGNVTGSVGSVVSGVTVTTNNDKTGYTASTVSDKTGYSLTSGEHTNIASDVLDTTASNHNTAGTIGNKINSAASAGDPWTTALPGSYVAGSAGNIVGNNLDAKVSAVKSKTDNLPASPAAIGSAMTLDLTQSIPTSNTTQTIGDALNAARAQGFGKWKVDTSAKTLTLFAADNSTAIWTFALDDINTPTTRTGSKP